MGHVIPVEEHDKGHQRLTTYMCEKGREGGPTLFTDTLSELTTLHTLFRFLYCLIRHRTW